MCRMVSIFDVAKYIVIHNKNVSPMKLQRLCYFCQAWYMAWTDEPLFEEDFRGWATGPFCLELYNSLKNLSVVRAKDIKGYIIKLTEEQKKVIDRVLSFYKDKDAQWLTQLSLTDNPWRESTIYHTNNVIPKKSIMEFYKNL